MRVKKIENISNEVVKLEHKNGAKTTLPPGRILNNIEVTNLDEVQGQVKVVHDLTEVGESKGKIRLDD